MECRHTSCRDSLIIRKYHLWPYFYVQIKCHLHIIFSRILKSSFTFHDQNFFHAIFRLYYWFFFQQPNDKYRRKTNNLNRKCYYSDSHDGTFNTQLIDRSIQKLHKKIVIEIACNTCCYMIINNKIKLLVHQSMKVCVYWFLMNKYCCLCTKKNHNFLSCFRIWWCRRRWIIIIEWKYFTSHSCFYFIFVLIIFLSMEILFIYFLLVWGIT